MTPEQHSKRFSDHVQAIRTELKSRWRRTDEEATRLIVNRIEVILLEFARQGEDDSKSAEMASYIANGGT